MDSQRLIETLARLLVQAGGARWGVLFRAAADGLTPVVEALAGETGPTVRLARPADWRDTLATTALDSVRRTRRTLVTEDAVRDPRLAADPAVQRCGIRSLLCVPVLHGPNLEGLLYLEDTRTRGAFTPGRVSLVETLADQASVSLRHERLFARLRAEVAQREQAEARLRAVAAGTAGAVGTEFFRDLVVNLARAMEVRIAFVTECTDPDLRHARALAFVDRGRLLDDMEIDLEGTPCRDVIGGRTCFYPDRLEEQFPKEQGLRSYLGVPLQGTGGATLGHLAVVDDRPMDPGQDHASLLQIFATRAATELERQRAQRAAERARRALAERQRLAAVGELASMIAHEIRSPLSTIGMVLEYLEGCALPERAVQRLRLALQERERLESLLGEILLFARPQHLDTGTLDLDALIRETVPTLRAGPLREHGPIDYAGVSRSVEVEGDRDKLRQVIINLLSNACQAAGTGGGVRIALDSDPGTGQAHLRVSNPGHIPEADLARLTEPFFTTRPSGTGLGLAIVERILEAHGGRLSIDCHDQREVRVQVTLPARPGPALEAGAA